ncbi:hypothetical protein PVL29_009720 [Vitis rotundifolia]|uniref:Uncharacterized protein n=1 Tax=Vitis rotundifolia TaxID=103349 RepID=A0AA39DTT2_VITRO|nr:hypothetical protein PVL29_009720 [Vitis rotundifolia]
MGRPVRNQTCLVSELWHWKLHVGGGLTGTVIFFCHWLDGSASPTKQEIFLVERRLDIVREVRWETNGMLDDGGCTPPHFDKERRRQEVIQVLGLGAPSPELPQRMPDPVFHPPQPPLNKKKHGPPTAQWNFLNA